MIPLRLRREDSAFGAQKPRGVDGAVLGDQAFVLRFFADEGMDVLVADILDDSGAQTVSEVEARGRKGVFVRVDTSNADDNDAIRLIELHAFVAGFTEFLTNLRLVLRKERPIRPRIRKNRSLSRKRLLDALTGRPIGLNRLEPLFDLRELLVVLFPRLLETKRPQLIRALRRIAHPAAFEQRVGFRLLVVLHGRRRLRPTRPPGRGGWGG